MAAEHVGYRLPYIYLTDKYEKMLRLVEDELQQRSDEGYDIAGALPDLGLARVEEDLLRLSELYDRLGELPLREGYPYIEPTDRAAIAAERPEAEPSGRARLDDEELYDRIYGGWIGRAVGGQLGQPVEHWTREEIETWLRLIEAYPLADYFPKDRSVPERAPEWLSTRLSGPMNPLSPVQLRHGSYREEETNHTVASLHVLEEFGPEFSPENVGSAWTELFSFRQLHTAERIAFLNVTDGIRPPETATYENPYREWIGAAIRGDVFGYVCPGLPRAAADLAYRDACFSHTKNGVYAEMLNAAMVAAAFTTEDPAQILAAGRSVIPRRSRLAEALRYAEERSRLRTRWEDAWQEITHAYGHHHTVHSIINAVIVAMSLLIGHGDFERTITIATMSGFDTDSNAATAGSILGVAHGASALPEKWTRPLHDHMLDLLDGSAGGRISEFARRTAAQVPLVGAWAAEHDERL